VKHTEEAKATILKKKKERKKRGSNNDRQGGARPTWIFVKRTLQFLKAFR